MDDGSEEGRGALEVSKRLRMSAGEFYTLLPPADDIHYVTTISEITSVSIHLLANDTACVWRHRFHPDGRDRDRVPLRVHQRTASA